MALRGHHTWHDGWVIFGLSFLWEAWATSKNIALTGRDTHGILCGLELRHRTPAARGARLVPGYQARMGFGRRYPGRPEGRTHQGTALAMQAAMRRHMEAVRRTYRCELRLRGGLNSGEKVATSRLFFNAANEQVYH